MKPVICIAGPTASGKSAYAVRVAKAVGGEIINADALQVYSDLHILSARPTEDEESRVPHHLFGHVAGDVRYSTGEWLRDVEPLILACLARDVVPVLVGGTGLYFRALLQGIADIPPIDDQTQRETAQLLDEDGIGALRALAERLDPTATARVLGDDPQRLQRIVNVARGTSRALTAWQANTRSVVPLRFARYCVLTPPRETLYARINARYDEMLRGGGLEEARRVFDLNYDPSLPMMKAIGLRQLRSYFKGLSSLDEAIEDAKRESRRFAKRQMTWFRNQPPKGKLLLTDADKDAFLESMTGVSF
ncbi:tRNA (adenosine(37)-N6)-dimethylallyltransferase MiaA [Litorimonas sp. WD9-15]|uniref:tRNA (adenosine(37)-N6)-dimethylallyltransferase MiaA n=1 Tax=Litorimonas sp. WD9-15 TaxID=3418716 RepID=UPI003D03AC79